MTRRLEALAYVALLLAAALACGGGSKKNDDSSKSDPAPAAESAVTVGAADLIADYKGNEIRGDNKWKGKLVKVTGIVGDIKKDILDKPYVTLGTGAEFEIQQVQCSLKSGQEGPAANLSKGTRATFRGRVSGLMMNVQVDDCELVPGGGAPAAAPQPQAPAKAQPAAARPPAKRK